jgi:hypothetical protein
MNPSHADPDADSSPMPAPQLSVVIPAYKAEYLTAALASLAAQTDTGFEVIVADDCSPADLSCTCANFSDRLDIRYIRFSENLGGKNLVGHWSRAIDQAKHDWIWLMGDDDELEPGCIATMRTAIAAQPDWKGLWRVDVVRINAHGSEEHIYPAFPDTLDARSYLEGRCHGILPSFACEYVFRRSKLHVLGGFVAFPLAWCSDDATWLLLAGSSGIRTVRGSQAKARWRLSTHNISGRGPRLDAAKVEARLQYLEWLRIWTSSGQIKFSPNDLINLRSTLRRWFLDSIVETRAKIAYHALPRMAVRLVRCPWSWILPDASDGLGNTREESSD